MLALGGALRKRVRSTSSDLWNQMRPMGVKRSEGLGRVGGSTGAALSDARGRALRGSHAALQGEHQQHQRDDPCEDHDGHVRRQHEAQ